MKTSFNNFFNKTFSTFKWLEQPGFLGMANIFNIVALIILFIAVIFKFFGDSYPIINNIILGLLAITVYSLILYVSIRTYWIKPPKFIIGSTKSPSELFNIFSHRSFLYGLFVYSFIASIFISGIILVISNFWFNLIIVGSNLFTTIFFIVTAIFTMLYFMYHISYKNIPLEVVKARLSLYIAISATLTAGLFSFSFIEIIKPLITYVGIAFVWLTFMINKIDSESKFSKKEDLIHIEYSNGQHK